MHMTMLLIDDDDTLLENTQFIETKGHGLTEHMAYRCTTLVNIIYQNKSTWFAKTSEWSMQIIKIKAHGYTRMYDWSTQR